MKNIIKKIGLLVGAVGISGCVTMAQDNVAPTGFEALFNGEDLTGWYGLPHFDPRKLWAMSEEEVAAKRAEDMKSIREHWSVQDGAIVNDGHGAYLTTEEEFGDLELWVDYKTVAKADSGIYLRANPQVQIWDYTEEGGKWDIGADKGSGGLYNNKDWPGRDPLVFADKPFGEWNRFRILQVGELTTVYLNGKLVVDHERMRNFWDESSPLWPEGPIQLQTHGGEIQWKNIFAREIEPEEANRLLQAHDDEGYVSVFNGRDFSGWVGPTENYQIQEGALLCRPGQGGTIYTEREYGDFSVRFEFQLPEGGNNGLAIRYPGEGDTAYVGMCELQVLDNTAEKYSQLDPRQYHGSAYGIAAAHRGFLRPVGEWNFQEVTVTGSRIVVDLNGTRILDTDLSEINDYMADRPHPGKDRKRGHFGFAGHGDPVAFRNVRIKTLD